MTVSHYPVQPGLFAGEYPGALAHGPAIERLIELTGLGIHSYIDLTDDQDRARGLLAYDPHFDAVEAATGIRPVRFSFAIPDMGIPAAPTVMRGALDTIRDELDAGRTCYVHCWGGIGRTGRTRPGPLPPPRPPG